LHEWTQTELGPTSSSAMTLGQRVFFAASISVAVGDWKKAMCLIVCLAWWCILHGRCRTSNRLRWHGLSDRDDSTLCAQEVETLDHLQDVSLVEKLGSTCYGSSVWRRLPHLLRHAEGGRKVFQQVFLTIWFGWSLGPSRKRQTTESISGLLYKRLR
jgi:hypothetical protein